MAYSLEEIDALFELDEEGRFLRLILPNDKLGEELDLIGKRLGELSLPVKIRVKKYSGMLYETALGMK